MSYELVRGSTLPDMTGAMQVFVYELRRIPLPRTWVNKQERQDPITGSRHLTNILVGR